MLATMSSTPLLFLTIFCFNVLQILCATDGLRSICYGNSTKVKGSISKDFEDNVQSLLSALAYESSSLHPSLSYTKTSVGRVSSRAYGSYLCRGDLNSKQCHNCLEKVTQFMSNGEINNSNCIGFDHSLRCIARYANTSKFSIYEKGLVFSNQSIGTNRNTSYHKYYNETLSNTLQVLIEEARHGNWGTTNFATRVAHLTGFHEKIYVLVQCATDISAIHCSDCLGELYSNIPKCCSRSHGGNLVHANCLMKYDNSSFFGKGSHSFMPRCLHVSLLMLLTLYFTLM